MTAAEHIVAANSASRHIGVVDNIAAADALDAAADALERDGRFRFEFVPGKHCPITAIEGPWLAVTALRNELDCSIVTWNDHEPDDAVVLTTMRRVASRLRETEK